MKVKKSVFGYVGGDFPALIVQAKENVIKSYRDSEDTRKRKWLKSVIKPYGGSHQAVVVLVLEGSPVKGLIVINYGRGTIIGYDCWMKKVCDYRTVNVPEYMEDCE